MKKVFISAISVMLLISVFFMIVLTKCGTWGNVKELKEKDNMTGSTVFIPIAFQYGVQNETTAIACDADITSIREQIVNLSTNERSYVVTLYPHNQLLIEINTKDNKHAMMLLKEQPNANLDPPYKYLKHAYLFTDLTAMVAQANTKIILPYHLVNDEKLRYGGNWISKAQLYYTDYSIDDFLSFYKKVSECYQFSNQNCFEKHENTILLKAPFIINDVNSQSVSKVVRIKFYQNNGKNCFSIDFTQD